MAYNFKPEAEILRRSGYSEADIKQIVRESKKFERLPLSSPTPEGLRYIKHIVEGIIFDDFELRDLYGRMNTSSYRWPKTKKLKPR